MQSGISVSAELQREFTSFLSDTSLFCLPVTITSESLTPQPAISFSPNTDSTDQFYTSLPLLAPLLDANTPLYLILRRIQNSTPSIIALTYIPSTSPVRAKTLFASTRATLVRGLGSEKFAGTVFAADKEEVLSEDIWRERDADESAARGVEDAGASERREDMMGEQERELEAIKREESKARNMSQRRDIGGSNSRMPFTADEVILDAYAKLAEEGSVVTMDITMPSEKLTVTSTESNISPAALGGLISSTKPQYTFYRYPNSEALIFIYTCPPNSPIKDRMMHASSRRATVFLAEQNGLKISHKLEASSGDEITARRLEEEVNPPRETVSKPAFARPRRPGR